MVLRPARHWFLLLIVLSLLLLIAVLWGSSRSDAPAAADTPGRSPYGAVRLLANLEDAAVSESSGVMASRARPGLFWTHNDSGDGPFLYRFDRQGSKKGVWLIAGATARDAEDCAAGPGPEKGRSYLYFGDIGDNASERRDCVVWRVPEPDLPEDAAVTSKDQPHRTATAEALAFAYPETPHDCEALLVHPVTGEIYLVTKERTRATSSVYKFPPNLVPGRRATLIQIAEIRLNSPSLTGASLITGGDIAPDGKRVILRDYLQLYEFTLPDGAIRFDEVWKQQPRPIPSPVMIQAEAVCYGLLGDALYLTSEQLPAPFYELR
jgi:hypothetical protein